MHKTVSEGKTDWHDPILRISILLCALVVLGFIGLSLIRLFHGTVDIRYLLVYFSVCLLCAVVYVIWGAKEIAREFWRYRKEGGPTLLDAADRDDQGQRILLARVAGADKEELVRSEMNARFHSELNQESLDNALTLLKGLSGAITIIVSVLTFAKTNISISAPSQLVIWAGASTAGVLLAVCIALYITTLRKRAFRRILHVLHIAQLS